MSFYVLRRNKSLDFICRAKDMETLHKKINESYWFSKSGTSKGSKFEMSDFMKDKIISKVTIENIENNLSEVQE